MSITDITTLIAAVGGLFLGLAAFGFVGLLIFRWEDATKVFSKVKFGRAEVELNSHGDDSGASAQLQSANQEQETEGPRENEGENVGTGNHPEELLDVEDAENADQSDEEETDPLILQAIDLIEEGKYDEGIRVGREAIKEENAENKAGIIALLRKIAVENGVRDAMSDLKRDHEQNPDNLGVIHWLAMALYDTGRESEAEKLLQDGLESNRERSDLEAERVVLAKSLSTVLKEAGCHEEAVRRLNTEISMLEDSHAKAELYEAIGRVYQEMPTPALGKAASMFELSLRYDPSRNSLRFDLAFLYSRRDNPGMALLHYKALLKKNPNHATALNNAGVCARNLSMSFAGTRYQQEAWDKGSTLAAANLAFQLMDAGFSTQAREILQEAQKSEDTHDNVLNALGRMGEVRREEDTAEEKLEANFQKVSKWRFQYAEALLQSNLAPEEVSGRYEGHLFSENVSRKLEVSVDEEGSVIGKASLSGANKLHFNGEMEGCGISFAWRVKDEDAWLNKKKKNGKGLLIFADGQLTGHIMEEDNSHLQLEKAREWKLAKIGSEQDMSEQ